MTIRQNMIRAAARAMIVADEANARVKWDFSKRMSDEEFREAKRISIAWFMARPGGDEVLALTVEQIAEGVDLGGVDG